MNDQSEQFLKSSNDLDQEFALFESHKTNDWELELRNNIEECIDIEAMTYDAFRKSDMSKIETR